MMLGARTGAWAKSGPTAKDYVQDGLIAMWDGIENAGWGVHDPNATVWKELNLSGIDLIGSGDVICIDDGFRFGRDGSVGYMRDGGTKVSKSVASVSACITNLSTKNTWIATFGLDSSNTNGKILSLWNNHYLGTGWNRKPKFVIAGGVNRFATYSVNYTGNDATEAFVDKNSISQESTEGFADNISDNLMIGCRGNNTAWNMIGTIHNLRVYDRKLTADEITANYSVDKARFGIT